MKILFVCNQGENRSKTAEKLFNDKFETKSAGLYSEKLVTEDEISWADLVVVMKNDQRKEISERFPKQYLMKKIISFDVEDIYSYDQPELINLLKQKRSLLK